MATELGMVVLLTITVVGIPFAIHRFIRWSLFAEACMLDDLSATGSLRRSSELVKGRWWRTFGFTVPFAAIQLTLFHFDLEARGAADTGVTAGSPDGPILMFRFNVRHLEVQRRVAYAGIRCARVRARQGEARR
jgi:hypothetical protein